MQLILVLAVLMMFGGRSGSTQNAGLSGTDMLEMLKYVSDDNGEMDKIIKEAEHVSEILSAFAPLAATFSGSSGESSVNSEQPQTADKGLYLKPIANIADDSIYNALSHAIT